MTTSALTADKTVQSDIRLGAPAAIILHRYGRPVKSSLQNGNGIVAYTADEKTMRDVLFYEAKFRFRKDRLVSVSLSNGE